LLGKVSPSLRNIVESFIFKTKFYGVGENIKFAPICYNPAIRTRNGEQLTVPLLQAENDVQGEILSKLKLADLLNVNNKLLDRGELELFLGFTLRDGAYDEIAYIGRLYAKRIKNVSPQIKLNQFLNSFKKGSNKIRKILDANPIPANLNQNRSFLTHKKTIGIGEQIDEKTIKKNWLGIWNKSFFPNDIRTFLFKSNSNTLGVGNRVHHINPEKNPGCALCLKIKNLPEPIETFAHVFWECPVVSKINERFFQTFFETEIHAAVFFCWKKQYFGCNNDDSKCRLWYIQILFVEKKLRNVLPTYENVMDDFRYHMGII